MNTHSLLDVLDEVSNLVKKEGGKALLVGGSVRDLLLQLSPKDFDLEVYGVQPDRLLEVLGSVFELDLVGQSFGVIKLKGYPVDISLPRRESKSGAGHRGFLTESDPSMTVREAASRRDFTINSIALDLTTHDLIDHFHGHLDLKNKKLVPTSSHFLEDPLRVLRGMQFAARFGLTASNLLIDHAQIMAPEYATLPPERIFEEWKKLLLRGENFPAAFDYLVETDWIRFYPEIEHLIGCEQDPVYHPEGDVFIHTGLALNYWAEHQRTADEYQNLVLGFALLCHDFAKPQTWCINKRGRISNPKHESLGSDMAAAFLGRMTNQKDLRYDVCWLVANHMRFGLTDGVKDSTLKKLIVDGRIHNLLRLMRCDSLSKFSPDSTEYRTREGFYDSVCLRVDEIIQLDLCRPIITGKHLIEKGIPTGPIYSKILDRCHAKQLNGVFNSEEGGLKYLDELLTSWRKEVHHFPPGDPRKDA